MLKSYLSGKIPQTITLVVLAIALAGVWLFMIADEKAILADVSARLEAEDIAVKRMEMNAGKTQRIINDYQHNLDQISDFRKNFLQKKQERIIRISDFLAQRARAHNVKLQRVDYESAKTREGDLELYLSELPLEGRYRDIRAFINDVETSGMFLIITRLSLQGEDQRQGVVSVELTLTTYFQGAL